MTRSQWKALSDVEQNKEIEKWVDGNSCEFEEKYQCFHDEYGDAAALWSDWIRWQAREKIEESLGFDEELDCDE